MTDTTPPCPALAVLDPYLKALGEGRTDDALALVADDVDWWTLGIGQMKKADLAGAYAALFGTVERIAMTFTHRLAEGDLASLELRSDYRLRDGRQIAGSLMHLNATVADGRIVTMREYIDMAPLAGILGAGVA